MVGARSSLTSGHSLSFTLTHCLLVNQVFPLGKLDLDFINCGHRASLDPRMGKDLGQGESLPTIQRNHLLKQVLELGRVDVFSVRLTGGMTAPENASTISRQELVQWVLNRCLLERRPLSEHGEEDDGCRE